MSTPRQRAVRPHGIGTLRRFVCHAAAPVVCAIAAAPANAVEIFVGPDDSIQAAIYTARDQIDMITVAPGFYFENLDLLGKTITLRSSDGPEVTFIGQDAVEPVIRCVSGEGPGTVVDGFTIWLGSTVEGGGMLNVDSSPTVMNCHFRSNLALEAGGGMSNRGSSPTVTDCIFESNSTAAGPGGGIFNDATSSPTVTRCTFTQNTSSAGGAIHNGGGDPVYIDCTLTSNNATRGGGIFSDGGAPQFSDCVVRSNFCGTLGGGMYFQGGGSPEVIDCVISGNFGEQGAGLFIHASDPLIGGCLITGNRAQTYGGGVYTYNGAAALVNCTLSANCGPNGGGALFDLSGEPTLTNCVLWGDVTGGSCMMPDEVGSAGGSAITIDYSNVEGGWTGAGTGNTEVDPLFADADGPDDFAGTEDDDYRPLAGSQLIDAGDNTAVPAALVTDIDGNDRFTGTCSPDTGVPGGGLPPVDMGAYEALLGSDPHPVMYVDRSAGLTDSCGASWGDAFDELSKALEVAATSGGVVQEIWVAAETYKPTAGTDRTKTFRLLNGVAVYGGFPPGGGDGTFGARDLSLYPTILSGDIDGGAGTEHSFHVVTAVETDATAVIDGFRIQSGRADDDDEVDLDGRRGGGMLVANGAPTVSDCIFRDNVATNRGGAMYIGTATLRLTNCAFLLNSANSADASNGGGGAVYADNGSVVTLGNCTFYDNVAEHGSGGGLYSFLATTTVDNCIFWSNSPNQIGNLGLIPTVSYSDVEGGGFFGPGDINVDPLFVNAGAGDLRLTAGSPCLGGGSDARVGPDAADVDHDGDVDEPAPLDLAGRTRIIDTVEMGAYEIQPTGACCAVDGTCLEMLTAFDCTAAGGLYQGDDVACAMATCPPAGACCFGGGMCSDLTNTACMAAGGAWQGDGTACASTMCPAALTCPADLDGTGDVGFSDIIALLAAWGPCAGCPADLDGSGDVGFSDIIALLAAWGACP